MFVTNNRLIVKTCGQTTLLCALEPIMKLVQSTCQLKVQVRLCFDTYDVYHQELMAQMCLALMSS